MNGLELGHRPQNPAEMLLYRAITWTWPIYLIGGLYVLGPALGWLLGGLAMLSLYLGPAIRADLRAAGPIPLIVWIWFAGMAGMLVSLWVGHMNWNLGVGATIKSTIGWAKGWALLALFPLIGAVLPIRVQPLARAHCVLGLWTLALLPLLAVAPTIGLPSKIFVSPLKVLGGPGPEYFSVYLYTLDPASWTPRWQFFAPWSPFAGLLGVLMVLFALEERQRRWMLAGVLGGLAMILMSKSRMSLVALPVAVMGPRMLPMVLRAWAWSVGAVFAASMAAAYTPLETKALAFVSAFKGARADSTRVRATLQRIAQERWAAEAPWFGHGRVEPGPHLVEYMPIGSHHTWYGLLFVKGTVGFLSFALPFAAQFLFVFVDAVRHERARLPLGVMMVLLILSMGENVEIEVYLLWPSLVALGIHARLQAADRRAARSAIV